MYVKVNKKIDGLEDAATWMYDLEQVQLASDYLIALEADPSLEFQGAQLVDSENLCLTRGEGTNDIDENGDLLTIIYTDTCIDFPEDPDSLSEDEVRAIIDQIYRQSWIINLSPYSLFQYTIQASCEPLVLKRLFNEETICHTGDTICNQCRVNHLDVELVNINQCIDEDDTCNQCTNLLEDLGPAWAKHLIYSINILINNNNFL